MPRKTLSLEQKVSTLKKWNRHHQVSVEGGLRTLSLTPNGYEGQVITSFKMTLGRRLLSRLLATRIEHKFLACLSLVYHPPTTMKYARIEFSRSSMLCPAATA